jgi:hypothetical protein
VQACLRTWCETGRSSLKSALDAMLRNQNRLMFHPDSHVVRASLCHPLDTRQQNSSAITVLKRALSDAEYCPAPSSQSASNSRVSAFIDSNFQIPKRNIAAWWTLASSASMPETAVDENRDFRRRKYEVGFSRQFSHVHFPSRYRTSNQVGSQASLRGPPMARFHQRHDSRASGWGYSIH